MVLVSAGGHHALGDGVRVVGVACGRPAPRHPALTQDLHVPGGYAHALTATAEALLLQGVSEVSQVSRRAQATQVKLFGVMWGAWVLEG